MVLAFSLLITVHWSRNPVDTGLIHSQFLELTLPVPYTAEVVCYVNLRLSPTGWTLDHLPPPTQEGAGNLLAAVDREPLSDIEVDV